MLISLCSDGETYVWGLESQNIQSFPHRPFQVDIAAVRRLYYAVDPTWISYTFAVTFLALCYIRGVIDGEISKVQPANILRSTLLTKFLRFVPQKISKYTTPTSHARKTRFFFLRPRVLWLYVFSDLLQMYSIVSAQQ